MNFRELLAQLRKRPGMFGVRTYGDFVSFINGYDAATNWTLLEGFHEWLQMRIGHFSGYVWSAIVREMIAPDREGTDGLEPTEDQSEQVRELALDLLDEFAQLRENRNGLKHLYRDFYRWEALRTDAIRSGIDED